MLAKNKLFTFIAVSLAFNANAQILIIEEGFESGSHTFSVSGNAAQVVEAAAAREGRYVLKSQLTNASTNPERTEVSLNQSGRKFEVDQDYWVGISIKLDEDFESGTFNDQGMLMQCHYNDWIYGDDFKPQPFVVRFTGDDVKLEFEYVTDSGSRGRETLVDNLPPDYGKWVDWVIHLRFSDTNGLFQIWRNGAQVVDWTGDNHLASRVDGAYLKFGLYSYQFDDINENYTRMPPGYSRTVYHDELRIAGSDGSYELVAPTDRLTKITQKLYETALSGYHPAKDQTTSSSDSKVSEYMNSMATDGSWDEIDYNVTTDPWPALKHAEQLHAMTMMYNDPNSSLFHNQVLKEKILLGLRFFYNKDPQCTHWHSYMVLMPADWQAALLLMKTGDEFGFPQDTLEKYALFTSYHSELQAEGREFIGANVIYVTQPSLYKACITENLDEVDKSFDDLQKLIRISPGIEQGIKLDYSYHQHEEQIYFDGYGHKYLKAGAFFLNLASGTLYGYPSDKAEILTDLLLDGFQWFVHKSGYDYGVSGRQIATPWTLNSTGLIETIDYLLEANPPRIGEIQAMRAHINGTGDFQYPGNRHFWKSDMMVQHGPDWYASVRNSSRRVVATERINGTNQKGINLGVGNKCIMVTGTEYVETPVVWDWSRIAGSTLESNEISPISKTYNRTAIDFAGGVSNGIVGFTAYEQDYEGVSVRKADLMTDEGIYCIGGEINASLSNPVFTNINQCRSEGNVVLSDNGMQSDFTANEMSFTDLDWVYHDEVGYYFPDPQNVTLSNKNQSGRYSDIDFGSSDDKLRTEKIFSAWIDHGTQPEDETYEYMIVPGKSLEDFKNWIPSQSYETVSNNASVQAVKYAAKNIYAAAFYSTDSTVTFKEGFTVSVSKPCLLLIHVVDTIYNISIADPTALWTGSVLLQISKELEGEYVVSSVNQRTYINFLLPSGDYAGSTVSEDFIGAPDTATVDLLPHPRTVEDIKIWAYHDNIYIESETEFRAAISDLSGRVMRYTDKNQIKLSSPGIYIVSVENKMGRYVRKVMLQ